MAGRKDNPPPKWKKRLSVPLRRGERVMVTQEEKLEEGAETE